MKSPKNDAGLFSWLYIGRQNRDGNLEEFPVDVGSCEQDCQHLIRCPPTNTQRPKFTIQTVPFYLVRALVTTRVD